MIPRIHILFLAAALAMGLLTPARAGERDFRLAAPPDLVASGFLKHLLPRFSLKMQTRITLVTPGEDAEATLGGTGTAVFDGLGQQWKFAAADPAHPGITRFLDWIKSDVGLRTIANFAPDDGAAFTAPGPAEAREVTLSFEGDPTLGLAVSRQHCKRCHAVTPADRLGSIGSTPSFSVLRSLPDWSDRFERFYVLNPHPAFTQVAEVTPPFHEGRPPPIVPVNMTLNDLEAIIAYVAGIKPADLGAPIKHQ